MTDIDFDFEGAEKTFKRFQKIKEQYDGDGINYIVGTNVKYGFWLEFGTENMPPYPWFRPALRELKANPEAFIFKNTDYGSIDEIESTEDMVEAIAFAIENQATENVNAQDPSANRSPGTEDDHPRRQDGNLTASIQAVRIS